MKKLLLVAATTLACFGTHAQETDPTIDIPEWTIALTCNAHKDDVYERVAMVNSNSKFGNNDIYNSVITLKAPEAAKKECKYVIHVNYECGETTATAQSGQILVKAGAEDITVTVGAFYESAKKAVRMINSYDKSYGFGDAKWNLYAYLPSNSIGENNVGYFNMAKAGKVEKFFSNNKAIADRDYIAGGAQFSYLNSDPASALSAGVYKSTLDFKTMKVVMEKASTVDITISEFTTFVSPVDVTGIPAGVTAYTVASHDGSSVTLEKISGAGIPANTPVILQAALPGSYSFPLSSETPEYVTYSYDKDNSYIDDTNHRFSDPENQTYLLAGVHQPHFLRINDYAFNESTGQFEKVSAASKIIAHPFTAYLTLSDTDLEFAADTLTLTFPEENEKYSFNDVSDGVLDFSHIVKPYIIGSCKHEAGAYSVELNDATFFDPEAAEMLTATITRDENVWPDVNEVYWDGIVPDSEENNDLYHQMNHSRYFEEPANISADASTVSFTATHAGRYVLTFTVKDEYASKFEQQSKSYVINVCPQITSDGFTDFNKPDENGNEFSLNALYEISIITYDENGGYSYAVAYSKDSEGQGSWKISNNHDLSKCFLKTRYSGDCYVKIGKSESEPTEDLAQSEIFFAPAADDIVQAGYELYDPEQGMDLTNATSLAIYPSENGTFAASPTFLDLSKSTPTAVKTLHYDENGEKEYFSLEGIRVQTPLAPGVYVCRKGSKASVIYVK